MAGWFVLLYLLVIAGLVGVAIYEHQTASSLSLPVSPALTILTILIPILSLLNTLYYHQSSPSSSPNSQPHLPLPPTSSHVKPNPSTSQSKRITLPSTLQLSQALLTISLLATFLTPSTLSSLPQGVLTECLLSSQWKSLWTSHNAQAIRQIQDALSCCGFKTTKDMAWPFPTGSPDDRAKQVDCVAKYGRHTPCLGAWEAQLKNFAGGEVSVLLLTGLAQFMGWYFAGRVKLAGGSGNGIGILALFKEIWRRLVGSSASAGRDEEEEEEEEWNNRTTGGRRGTGNGTGRARNGRGGHRGSRLLVGGGEVERLVDEVDDDDEEEETGGRDTGRDLERGSSYGATGGNVWRSG